MVDRIDRDNPVPIYWQLAELIKAQISYGKYQPGDRLPTEQWLSSTYGISRVTVRKALQMLIGNGVLERSRSKGPTVAYPRLSRQTVRLTSLSEDLTRMGHVPSNRILQIERTVAPPDVAYLLEIQPGDPVFHMERLRLSDGIPLAIHNCYYPLAVCGKVLTPDFNEESIYHYLERNGIVLTHAKQTVAAQNANDAEASLLSVPRNGALLHIVRISSMANNTAVEYSDMLYNPARYDLRMDLYR